jgi:hypothetical protein
MTEIIDALRTAPPWAQILVPILVLTMLASVIEKPVRRRRARAAFARLASAAGAPVTTLDWVTETFPLEVAGRQFEVRREWHTRGHSGRHGYRGPVGHLLVTSTPLAGKRWELHQVDIATLDMAARRASDPLSGDATFDDRFRVRQDGVPVREAWLDAATCAAVTALFDAPGVGGPLWVHGQAVHLLRREPWWDVDLAALRRVLEAQAAVATALERTAGWRGPAV